MNLSLSAIFHSFTCPLALNKESLKDLRRRKLIAKGEEPQRLIVYPALEKIDLESFAEVISGQPYASILERLERRPKLLSHAEVV